MKGIITKGIAGFYYVKTDVGLYECKARGVFKKRGQTPMVGDYVEIEPIEAEGPLERIGFSCVGTATLTELLPRKNAFIRPPIANVDCFVVVVAILDPEPHPSVIDRFLVTAEKHHTESILCINKVDLADSASGLKLRDLYEGIYPVFGVSGTTGDGIEELKAYLKGKICALAGPSGVGKSTLLNLLMTNTSVPPTTDVKSTPVTQWMETGELSDKTKRGRHTTRHAELFETPFDAMIFDTPGFTSFDVIDAEEGELQFLYPEMAKYLGTCKYDNCRHIREPDCGVRQAVREGHIRKTRYLSYREQLLEIRKREENRY